MNRLQVVVPTVVALVAVAILLRTTGPDPTLGEAGYVVDSAPTPYSHSHAIVQSRPGAAEEQPPTF